MIALMHLLMAMVRSPFKAKWRLEAENAALRSPETAANTCSGTEHGCGRRL
jgi:hypothetical protein